MKFTVIQPVTEVQYSKLLSLEIKEWNADVKAGQTVPVLVLIKEPDEPPLRLNEKSNFCFESKNGFKPDIITD